MVALRATNDRVKRDCNVRKLDYSKIVLKESKPKQVDKKSGFPEEEEAVWGAQERNRSLEFSKEEERTIFLFYIAFKDYIKIIMML